MKFAVSEGRLSVKLPGPSAFQASGTVSHSSFLQLTPDIERSSRGRESALKRASMDPNQKLTQHDSIFVLMI